MIDLQFKLDLPKEVYDDVAAFVAQHEITVEQLLKEFFREIHAKRTLNPLLHILSLKGLERVKASDADFAAGRYRTVAIDEVLAEIDEG